MMQINSVEQLHDELKLCVYLPHSSCAIPREEKSVGSMEDPRVLEHIEARHVSVASTAFTWKSYTWAIALAAVGV
jgi:hypothetical protein